MEEGSNLAKKMRKGTIKLHMEAERTPFISRYFRYDIQESAYKNYISFLYFVYKTLEEELSKHHQHPYISAVYFPKELHRTEAIERDLDHFFGSRDSWTHISHANSIMQYVHRLKKAGESNPALLLAHAYTRYMGDLSGGQLLKTRARTAL
eukprot:TRINITY_DN14561_c0_g1_i1.p1 TRINITY_DN14561_c0_g1~~TRINITY_DN14561_c0_g1_i1.p1  ORF type:complete len:151 (+),score=18.92 TRINITY_DN14561_c0_g1_i1:69-521(+)